MTRSRASVEEMLAQVARQRDRLKRENVRLREPLEHLSDPDSWLGSLHPNKKADTFRRMVAGSGAFNAMSRSSLLLAVHPEDETSPDHALTVPPRACRGGKHVRLGLENWGCRRPCSRAQEDHLAGAARWPRFHGRGHGGRRGFGLARRVGVAGRHR